MSEEREGEVVKVAEVINPEKDVLPDPKKLKTVDENGEEQTVEYEAVEEAEDDDEEQSFDDESAEDDDEDTAAVAKEVDSSNIIPRYYYCVGI